jgi:replication factor C small subunit
MAVELWVEKFRPTTLDEYVWRDPDQRKKVEEWIAGGVLPHLMLSGVSGTGKTSLAKLVLRALGIPSGDILEIPASRERKIDDIQDRIQSFVSTWALNDTGVKYILLDEADAMSPLAQKMLRTDMETYADVCRFIFTCNYPEKIIPAIHGRCQGFAFKTLDYNDFTARVGEILVAENIAFDVETLLTFVEATYPDLRKCINTVQQHCREGSLRPLVKDDAEAKDYLVEMVNLFANGRYLDARKLIVSQAQAEEYPDIYRFLYRNLELWGDAPHDQDEAILIIRRAVVHHTVVADIEINLSACLIELSRLRSGGK